jgi:hypothetical protein
MLTRDLEVPEIRSLARLAKRTCYADDVRVELPEIPTRE